jgi:hypothetical protein
MAGKFSTTHKRVSGTADKADFKKDGYARGPVPKQAIGTKVGKTDDHGYSGPEVAIPERGF